MAVCIPDLCAPFRFADKEALADKEVLADKGAVADKRAVADESDKQCIGFCLARLHGRVGCFIAGKRRSPAGAGRGWRARGPVRATGRRIAAAMLARTAVGCKL